MIRIATRRAAGSELGSPTPDVPLELVEVTTRLAGVLRDLGNLGRATVPHEELNAGATTAWADSDSLYIEAHVPDVLDESIDVSACGHRVFVRIDRSRVRQGEQPRPSGHHSEPAGSPDDATRVNPAIRIEP